MRYANEPLQLDVMRFVPLLCFVGPLSAGAQSPAAESLAFERPVRSCLAVNDGWRFLPEDRPEAAGPDLDDSAWTPVQIPHTWNTQDPFDDEPDYRRGPSWYRRKLHLGRELEGRRLFLHFEGVHQLTHVFVNGKPAGRHKGGYTAFAFDITDLLHFGENGSDNVIAVRADSSHDDSIPPLDIGYAFYGGIYRDVWLIATDAVHFDVLDHASPGIRVDTPSVSAESGRVRVRGAVVNDGSGPRELNVVTVIADAENRTVARMQSKVTAPPGGRAAFEQQSGPIAAPKLWSPDHPYLYRVEAVVRDGDKVLDRVQTRLGFRWFKFDPDQGFLLNGSKFTLRGASRHQDHEGLGSALPNWLHRSDLEWLKRMGGNFLRLAHYPQEQEVLDAADSLGLIVWEEIPIVSTMSTSSEFAETCRTNLTEMIRQHYNHPSVVLWGYMNEVLLNWRRQKDPDPDFPREVIKLARELDDLARKEDPTRVTVMAMDGTSFYDEAGISEIPQVAGWNLYCGWYSEGLQNFGKFLDRQREKYPNRCLIVSEYGAGSDERLHSLAPVRFDHTTEYMCRFHESHWQQIQARPWLAGTLIWNQFDFSQPKAADSIAHVNQKGMLTWDRRPKDVHYFYQANWSPDPVLYIASREWSRRTGTDPAASPGSGCHPVKQPLKVYSNLDEVELFVNGESLGAMKPDALRSAVWDAPFRDGANLLEARGHRGEQKLHDSCRVHFKYRSPRLADPSVPFDELAVNVGSNAQFIDASGLVWEADQPYVEGGFGYVGGQDRYSLTKGSRVSADILGTPEDPLYQLYREGIEAFRFDVPDGDYELDLRFTEYVLNEAGQRVFRVRFNGDTLIDRMDLFAEYGPRYAVPKAFRVRVTGGRGAVIEFEPIAGQPILSGVRLRRLP